MAAWQLVADAVDYVHGFEDVASKTLFVDHVPFTPAMQVRRVWGVTLCGLH
jgi:hypothetical protein